MLLLSGPNLNLLGEREPEIYGTTTLDDHVATAAPRPRPSTASTLEHLQSNHEGELVDAIHGAGAGAPRSSSTPARSRHYAWALARRARRPSTGVKVELHLSNPNAREAWRHTSVIAPVVDGHDRRASAATATDWRSTRVAELLGMAKP